MTNDINLISTKKLSATTEKRIRVIRIIAVVSLIIVGFSSVLLFVLNSVNSPSAIKKQEDSELSKITALNDKAVKYTVLKERLDSISDILKSRFDYVALINLIIENKPADVDTTSLSLDKTSVNLTVSSQSLLSLNEYLKSLIETSAKNKMLSNLTIDNLSANERTGLYTLSIKAVIHE